MTTLNTTKLMELFRYLQTFIWLNKNPSTLYSDSFFNWNKSITTWRICLQCQRNCFCPSLQIYKTFKFSFSQCLRTTFKISHLYKAEFTSPGPSCSSGCAAAAAPGARRASGPPAWGSSPPPCRRTWGTPCRTPPCPGSGYSPPESEKTGWI